MKFKEGKALKTFSVEKQGKKIDVTLRYPKMSDARQLMDFINALVDEKSYLIKNEKIDLSGEKKWLSSTMDEIEKKEKIMVVVEIGGKVVGSTEVRRGKLGQNHTCTLGISLAKEYRGIGIGKYLMNFIIFQAKKEFGTKLVIIQYYRGNDIAKNLYDKIGFKEAGAIPRMGKVGDRYYDEVFMYKEV